MGKRAAPSGSGPVSKAPRVVPQGQQASLLDSARACREEFLEDAQDFKATLEEAIDTGRRALPGVAVRWGSGCSVHHSSYRAIVNKGGEHGQWSIPTDLVKPSVTAIDPKYKDFWESLEAVSAQLQATMQTKLQMWLDSFLLSLDDAPGLKERAAAIGSAEVLWLSSATSEQLQSVTDTAHALRAHFAGEAAEAVQDEVRRALANAASKSGTGSHAARKQAVTEDLPQVRLDLTAGAAEGRVDKALEKVDEVVQKIPTLMVERMTHAMEMLQHKQADEAQQRAKRAALREAVEPEHQEAAALLKRLMKSLPAEWAA